MTAESCRECALDLKKQVDDQGIELARLEERIVARDDALKLATDNLRLAQSQTWLKTVAVIGWILAGVGVVVNVLLK